MNANLKSCEEHEIDLSSLLDGELSPAEAADAMDHALGCASCAEFFRAARRVASAAEGLRDEDGALSSSRADELWRAVERRASSRAPRAADAAGGSEEPGRARRTLRAAALVALGLGGGYLLSGLAGPGAGASAVLAGGGAGAPMDERRFVAVADELLSSDVRYQRAMLEVLRLVPAIETGEGLRNEDAPRIVQASNDGERRASGAI